MDMDFTVVAQDGSKSTAIKEGVGLSPERLFRLKPFTRHFGSVLSTMLHGLHASLRSRFCRKGGLRILLGLNYLSIGEIVPVAAPKAVEQTVLRRQSLLVAPFS